MKTIRINLEVEASYRKRLKDLQESTGATSQSEVFRKAIHLLEEVQRIQKSGGRLKAFHESGEVERITLI